MKRYFKDARLTGYFYDTEDRNVYSTKRNGAPHCMSWTDNRDYGGRVKLTDTYSRVVSLTHSEIILALNPRDQSTIVTVTKGLQPKEVTVKKNTDAPSFPYVLFCERNECSQYFHAGTGIEDAFALFAKRKIILDPKNVQIVNILTGIVSKLKVKVVETVTYTF